MPIRNLVKVYSDMHYGKCEHRGRSIVTQFCEERRDTNIVVKYDKLAYSVDTESVSPLSCITVIPDPYFSLSKG